MVIYEVHVHKKHSNSDIEKIFDFFESLKCEARCTGNSGSSPYYIVHGRYRMDPNEFLKSPLVIKVKHYKID